MLPARLLTVSDVCEFLQADETTVNKLVRSGALKGSPCWTVTSALHRRPWTPS
jgi:hypothetical protein